MRCVKTEKQFFVATDIFQERKVASKHEWRQRWRPEWCQRWAAAARVVIVAWRTEKREQLAPQRQQPEQQPSEVRCADVLWRLSLAETSACAACVVTVNSVFSFFLFFFFFGFWAFCCVGEQARRVAHVRVRQKTDAALATLAAAVVRVRTTLAATSCWARTASRFRVGPTARWWARATGRDACSLCATWHLS